MTLYVIIMICKLGVPCNQEHARVYQSYKAEPGQIVCGIPGTTKIIQSELSPDPNEYLVVRCKLDQ